MSPPSPEARELRVGYVLKKYPRLSETFILDELLGLEAEGVRLSVFSLRLPDEGTFHADLSQLRAPVRYVPAFGRISALEAFRIVPALDDPAVVLARAYRFLERMPQEKRISMLVQGLQLAGLVLNAGIRHLHAHFMTVAAHTAYLTHLFTGIPFTVTTHAKDIYRDAVDRSLFSEVARAAVAVVTVCEANREYLLRHVLEDSCRVERIYNGIPLGRVSPNGEPRERRLIVAVGRLVEKKGFDVLLEACALLSQRGTDFRCVLLGDGEQRDGLLDDRRRLGLEDVVHMPGAVPRDEALRWMRRGRVLAAPYRTGTDGNRDALPTVLIEAMALGLPVVTTPVGGVPEIVDPGTEGLLVGEEDPGALADALRRLLEDDPLWSRMSLAGPTKAAERFDRRKTLPQLIGLFAESAQPALSARQVAP